MPVNRSFKALLSQIDPLPSEVEQARSHAASVKKRLDPTFRLTRFSLIGSYARGSAIRTHGDADYFAVLPLEDCRSGDSYVSSTTLMNRAVDDLRGRFMQAAIASDGQAVVVPFDSGDGAIDVIPGFFQGYDDARQPVYYIPDGAGGWRPTSPESHNRLIEAASEECHFRLKYTARLLNYWRECRTPRVPLSSFHVELLLAGERTCSSVKNYTECLADTLQLLARRECRAYKDPLGISGYVAAADSEAQREATLDAVEYARDHAKSALEAENNGWPEEAFKQWDTVFNGEFPY
jgi:hypothetical protein